MNAHDDARTPGARMTTPSERGLNSPDKVEKPLTDADLAAMLRFANTAAYLVTTKKGAIKAMPTPEQVEETMARAQKDF